MRKAIPIVLAAVCSLLPALTMDLETAGWAQDFPAQGSPDPGDQMLQEHQFTEARIFLERRLKGHPNDAVTSLKLSKALEGLGELDGAIKMARKTTEIQPKNIQAHFLLAHYLDENRDDLAARVQYEIVIELKGPISYKIASYGPYLRLIIKDGRYKDAEKLAKKWVHQNPDSADCHFNRAWLLAQSVDRKNKEMAVTEYKTALDLDRKRASARFNLALLLNDLGKKTEAVSQLQKFLILAPTDADAPKAQELLKQLRSNASIKGTKQTPEPPSAKEGESPAAAVEKSEPSTEMPKETTTTTAPDQSSEKAGREVQPTGEMNNGTTDGLNGASGTSGTSGTSGRSGQSGGSGRSGGSGSSGDSGTSGAADSKPATAGENKEGADATKDAAPSTDKPDVSKETTVDEPGANESTTRDKPGKVKKQKAPKKSKELRERSVKDMPDKPGSL